MYNLVLTLVLFALCLFSVSALNVDWLPSSGEGPLPLSRAYREKLGRLCQQVEGREREGKKLAPELLAKRDVIKVRRAFVCLCESLSYTLTLSH